MSLRAPAGGTARDIRRGLRAAGILAVLVFVVGVSGGRTFFASADESLARLDAQLEAVEKDLDEVSKSIENIGAYFLSTDADLQWWRTDENLMAAEQSAQLAEAYGRSNEVTATRLETGIRDAEQTLEVCLRTWLSPTQRKQLAGQEKRLELLRKGVDAAKEVLANSAGLRLVPAFVKILRENDAAYVAVMEQLFDTVVADLQDRSGTVPTIAAIKANKERLAPSVSLTKTAVKRFSGQTGFEDASACRQRLDAQSRLSERLVLVEREIVNFQEDERSFNDAWEQLGRDYSTLAHLKEGRPSDLLRDWYRAKFGEPGETIRDCLEKSRALAKGAKG